MKSVKVLALILAGLYVVLLVFAILVVGRELFQVKPRIEYLCSSSEVQYLETEKGLSVSFDKYGVPVPCK